MYLPVCPRGPLAHEVDFAVLSDATRVKLHALLHGTSWWGGEGHSELDCERFADLVAWSYWMSPGRAGGAGDGRRRGGSALASLQALIRDARIHGNGDGEIRGNVDGSMTPPRRRLEGR